jgi:hypothetical protein
MLRPDGRSARPCLVARLVAPAAALILLTASGGARGDDAQTMVAARAAYDRGAAAYDRGEYAVAAAEFARADELAPNPVALTHAVKAAHRADDPVLGMSLVERSSRGPSTSELTQAVEAARARFAARVGQLAIRCPAVLACRATIDGAPAAMGRKRWVTAGQHAIEVIFEGGTEKRTISIVGGDDYEITPSGPAPSQSLTPPTTATRAATGQRSPSSAEPDSGGVSPAWFWVGAAVTLGLAGATTASGLDATSRHDEYNDAPTADGLADGHAAETRTNVLLGATAAAAVATAALGIFFVRWSSGDGSRAAAVTLSTTASAGGSAMLGLRGAL